MADRNKWRIQIGTVDGHKFEFEVDSEEAGNIRIHGVTSGVDGQFIAFEQTHINRSHIAWIRLDEPKKPIKVTSTGAHR
jgi:hypothetical protein